MEKYKNQINKFIQDFLNNLDANNSIVGMLEYVLINDSKKLRAILILLFGEIFGIFDSDLKNYCVAVEMMHSYTLIHDDLPALDDDDVRRGKSSTHKKYGEGNAILLGDGLQTWAFELMSQQTNRFSHRGILNAINKFAETMGIFKGVVYGQFLDIENKNFDENTLDFNQILNVHTHKTAVFFAFCCALPAILLEKEQNTIDDCYNYGLKFGMLFQFLDDIMDFESKTEACNVCNVLGFEKAKEAYREELGEFLRINKFQQLNGMTEEVLNLKK